MQRNQPTGRKAYPRLDVRSPIGLGLGVIILFFGFGLGAAALAPIDKGVSLPGTIIVQSKVKPVAHPRGGVVEKIHVIEGQQVEEGQLLVSLETATLDEQIASLKAQSHASQKQLALARQEAATISDLQSRSLASKSKVLALDRLVAEIEKDTANFKARVAAAESERTKTDIRAPVAGRVLSLQAHAVGAVLQPGAPVVEIVPEADKLVVEGRLQPHQLENVRAGMPAKVWLTALSWREQRPLVAKLSWISADSVEDKRSGNSYFVARLELDETREEIVKRMALQPGMRAEILLMTGQRTLLDQLIDPLMRNVQKAFHG
mgnify:CR=1 FL=1